MPNLSFHDKQHIQRILQQQGIVGDIFNEFARKVSLILRKWKDVESNNVWVRNAAIEKETDKLLQELYSKLYKNISEFSTDAWNRSNLKNDEIVYEFIKGLSISQSVKDGMMGRNIEALKAFQKRMDNEMTVSDRIWKITDETKTQMEMYLGSGVSSGRSASEISRDIRQLQNNPDRRFRRISVKDEQGNKKLVMSKPMADYHPGQGVYRSSYQNALRLAATETNMSYRKADNERWSKMGFVTGIEIKRSPANRGPCPVCDVLAGEYPKGFVFLGWHPRCWCIGVPVMLEDEEFIDYLLTGQIPEDKLIRDIPEGAKKLFKESESMKESYVAKENEKYFKENKDNEISVYDKIKETEDKIRMNKDFESGVAYDKSGNILINKIGKGTSISFTDEEASRMKNTIFTHNHPRGWGYPEKSMQRIGNSFSIEDIVMAIKTDLAEIRAVTPNYTFVMKRPQNGWGLSLEEAKKAINVLHVQKMNEFQSRIMKGTTTTTKANTVHFHQIWKSISKKYGWEYSKKKTR